MANTYFEAAYPAPWQVLGVPLKPFSLGHYIKLHRLGCAFVADDAMPATLKDLVLGVAVCSMPSHPDASCDPFWNWISRAEPEGWLESRWYKLRCKLAILFKSKLLSPAELDMVRFGRRVGVVNLPEKVSLFAEYINAHAKAPAYWEDGADGKKSGAHWSHAMLAALVSKCGYTQEEAHNVPMSKALADYFKYAEGEGCVRLMNQTEADFLEKANDGRS